MPILDEVRSVPGAGLDFHMHPELHASICRAGEAEKSAVTVDDVFLRVGTK